jgi:hypothetical protein
MPPVRLERLARLAFDQIRQASSTTPAVLIRQLEAIRRLAPRLPDVCRQALSDQADAILETASALVTLDRRDLDAAWQRAHASLEAMPRPFAALQGRHHSQRVHAGVAGECRADGGIDVRGINARSTCGVRRFATKCYQRGWGTYRYLYGKYGRHEDTRTPDLYRVNPASIQCSLNPYQTGSVPLRLTIAMLMLDIEVDGRRADHCRNRAPGTNLRAARPSTTEPERPLGRESKT